MKKPFVISISGISGGGKTTAADALKAKLANTEIICFDDIPGDLLNRDYCEWSESGADCNEWNLSPITEKIKKLLLEPLNFIILDYPFGKTHRDAGTYIDLAVWIDIPPD
ncbi:MAG: hypothetical protein FWF08_02430, partial [Oscillospiraceae bacterium]|nr:hypothetical protein [Oscillospiraceae bacterium]